jgi:hypothetical protein
MRTKRRFYRKNGLANRPGRKKVVKKPKRIVGKQRFDKSQIKGDSQINQTQGAQL